MKVYIAGVLPGFRLCGSETHKSLVDRLQEQGHQVLNPPVDPVFQKDARDQLGTLLYEADAVVVPDGWMSFNTPPRYAAVEYEIARSIGLQLGSVAHFSSEEKDAA